MKKLLILQGIPGSGKSYWAKEFVRQNTGFIRVCRDDLRRMRGIYWLPEQEHFISQLEQNCVREALKAGYNVVLDATNLNSKYWGTWRKLAGEFSAELEFKRFDTTLELCLDRDKNREESVGEDVVRKMYTNYLKVVANPPTNEVEAPFIVERIVQDSSLPKAIICDLDGCLCLHNGRGPYEFDKCDTDLVNGPVVKILSCYDYVGDSAIFYLSGREDSCRSKTVKWLEDNGLWFRNSTKLFMRKTGDRRKDCIVKKEIFDAEIKGKYFIDFCLDDRDQVVKLWRNMGLTCLQVAEGNF